MATALAHAPGAPASRFRAGAPLRVAQVDDLDLDAAMGAALAPHVIAAERDARVAPVVSLDAYRDRRGASARVRRARLRAVLVAVGLAVLLAVGVGSLGTPGADADAPTPVGDTVVVQPGQTLWDVAADVTPAGQDVRVTVQQLRELNGLGSGSVPAWTPLVLPAPSS